MSRIGYNLNLIGKAYNALERVDDTFSILTEDEYITLSDIMFGIAVECWDCQRADVKAWEAFSRDLKSKVFSTSDGLEYFPQLLD